MTLSAKRFLSRLVIAGVGFACVGTAGSPLGPGINTVAVAAVTVTPPTPSTPKDATVQLTATTKDPSGNTLTGRTVTWTSGTPAVAAVDPNGMVTGLAVGTSVITATSEGKTGTATVSITPPSALPVATVTLAPANPSVAVGATVVLTATLKDAQGATLTGRTITWTSGTPSVASVTNGTVTGLQAGTSVITATSETKTGSTTVTVIAVAPSAAECASPQAGWVFCDDFEQDRMAQYFEVDNASGNFMRTASVGFGGSYGMRGKFLQAAISAGSLHLAIGKTPQAYMRPSGVGAGTANFRELYWRVYVNHQAGWTGGGGDKMSRAIIFSSSTTWAEAAALHVWSSDVSPTWSYLGIEPIRGTDLLGNVLTTGFNDFAHFVWLGPKFGTFPMFDAAHVGQWYCVEAHMKLNTAGNSDGVAETWINGTADVVSTTLNYVATYNQYGINSVNLENYWNTGSPVAQERYFDNFVVSTQRIGCLP